LFPVGTIAYPPTSLAGLVRLEVGKLKRASSEARFLLVQLNESTSFCPFLS